MGKKLTPIEIAEHIIKYPNHGFDSCSICNGVETQNTMKQVNPDGEDFDLICDECNTLTSIDTVYINLQEKQYLVIGTNIPVQVRHYDELDEWNSVNNMNGEPWFDVHISFDDSVKCENPDDYYQFEYVNLVHEYNDKESISCLTMGDSWANPDNIIITKEPIAQVVIGLYHKLQEAKEV